VFLCSKRYFPDGLTCRLPAFLTKGETFQIGDSNIRFHEEGVVDTGGPMYTRPISIRLGQSLSFS
jgi:hypothetical protein